MKLVAQNQLVTKKIHNLPETGTTPETPFSFEAFLQAYDDIESESSFIADEFPLNEKQLDIETFKFKTKNKAIPRNGMARIL